jgi:hypothetical protein
MAVAVLWAGGAGQSPGLPGPDPDSDGSPRPQGLPAASLLGRGGGGGGGRGGGGAGGGGGGGGAPPPPARAWFRACSESVAWALRPRPTAARGSPSLFADLSVLVALAETGIYG